MAKKIVTLFVRDSEINLLVAKGQQVQKWASLPLEPGLVSQGLVLDEVQVADRIKELFSLEKVKKPEVIVGLSGVDSLYRIIALPEVPEAILPEAIRREARRVIPVPLDEVYLSYQSIPALARGERRIFLAIFPRNVADALLRTLRQADLEPYIMDLAPLALCRTPNEPRAIIVNARLEHLTIMVIADRLPELIRRLSLPSDAESLSEKLPTITEEFSRTIAFYNSSHMEKPLDATVPVFVCGELAEAPQDWQSLVGGSGYSVSLLPSPMEYPEAFSPNEFMVNIGLALKELSLEKEGANFSLVNFNALPEVYRPRPLPVRQILVPIGITVAVGLLVYMGLLVRNITGNIPTLRSQLASAESHIAQTHNEITTLQAQVAQVEAQVEPVEATSSILNATLTTLGKGREEINGDLGQIVNSLSTKVDLTEVNHGGASVTISGIAPDEDEIFKYARNLRSGGRFSVVIISSITQEIKEEESAIDFEGSTYYFKEETKQFRFGFLLR